MSVAALDGLVDALASAFDRGASGSDIARLLGEYAREHRDWREFALFDADGYTRNLVARSATFELLILCWNAGQESPIHNHEGQDCWMAVLEGRMEEVSYCRPEEVRPGPLEPHEIQLFEPHSVTFIHDEIGLHLVRPALPDRPAVSMHLYADPYDACNCYHPETGEITRVGLVDYSNRGRLLAQEA